MECSLSSVKSIIKAAVTAAAAMAFCLSAGSAQAAKTMGFTYESPGDPIFSWIQTAGPTKVPYVIINAPNNGNLVAGDPSYIPTGSWSPSLASWVTLSQTLHNAGIKVICYVDSAYTNRPVWEVENDMSQYLLDGFTVDGFFIDDVAWGWSAASGDGSGTTHGQWYTSLYNFAHTTMPSWNNPKLAASPTIINNPGSIGDVSNWMTTCDLNVIFEGPYNTFTNSSGTTFSGYTSWSPSGTWVTSYPASRFINLVTNVPNTTTVDTIFNGAANKRAGYLYVTNVSCDWQAGFNTYGTDPTQTIWNREILKSQ
ncbi:MAG: spherulation-specific family 4 protein [Capsulimonas sp.]|uniref:spherulation-specific family 4 protein n=1 Tax=Capsulimonas sp. TaxID=2494211 RepID=UPI003262E4B7